jgi:phosphoglycerate kinase
VLENLAPRIDTMLIGGGMANTFLKANGADPGNSATEDDLLATAGKILDDVEKNGNTIILPVDVVTAEMIEPRVRTTVCDVEAIPPSDMALDIGPRTSDLFRKEIGKAATIVWNGPMGVFETEPFKNGTLNIARAVGAAAAYSVVGGGDTVRAVQQFGVADRISYISTGGGAFMEYMEGRTLPGVAALEDN